jgi:uncharacterized membrane protein YuzA (DUF378 family)
MIDKKTMEKITMTSFILVLIGALNWGLVVFDFNLVEMIGLGPVFAKIIYGAIGISALILAWTKWKEQKSLGL